MRSEKTQPKKPESRARALENKSCQAALERSMTKRTDFGEYADTAWTYGGDRPQDMQVQQMTGCTKTRGSNADEYEIYVDCAGVGEPVKSYDEWLNS
jgi:hypothetical protein